MRFRLFIKELTGNSKVMPVEKAGKNATDLLVVAEDLSKSIAKRSGPLRVRGIRKVVKKDTKITKENTIKLGNLTRLPDTAEKILSISQIMGADQALYQAKNSGRNKVLQG